MPRVFAISDIHIDYRENFDTMLALSGRDYQQDAIIIAGDVSDNLGKLKVLFNALVKKFAHVFFVPGNHDLWVRFKEAPHSVEKFNQVLSLCAHVGVKTQPFNINSGSSAGGSSEAVWIIPLFSWYTKHGEGDDTLYFPKKGEDKTLSMWSDNYHAVWPDNMFNSGLVTKFFLDMNERYVSKHYEGIVISFSHFLPRSDLICSTPKERGAMGSEFVDPHPAFNFSSVAGTSRLESQIRHLGSQIHIYGHQHRNRHREIDNVTYISHCMGYPHEREGLKTLFAPVSRHLKVVHEY